MLETINLTQFPPSKQLRLLRQASGLTLHELARAIDTQEPYLSDLELGKKENGALYRRAWEYLENLQQEATSE